VEVENRSGIVHITEEGTVYGGGAYDGKVNTKLANDINGVHRAFAVSAFHPAPKRVLMVGLASGSWARIIADHPQVESLHVVEINKGYLSAIDKYPEVADVVSHPKVKITIDDGRRFIRAIGKENPEQKYDLIIMNTTWHWRAYASTILSVDFLRLTKTVLAPGGMIFYNATYAPEVHRTALEAFPASLRYSNMVLASDSPINIDLDRWERVLRDYRMRGEPVLDFDNPEHQTLLAQARQRFLTVEGDEWDTLEPREHIVTRTAGRRVITDDNMGTEWQGK
jgi:spermidine synthase